MLKAKQSRRILPSYPASLSRSWKKGQESLLLIAPDRQILLIFFPLRLFSVVLIYEDHYSARDNIFGRAERDRQLWVGRPSCSPISWIVQMLGWFSAEAAQALWRTRSNACWLQVTSSGRNLIATIGRAECLRPYTPLPMPPPPIFWTIAIAGNYLADWVW